MKMDFRDDEDSDWQPPGWSYLKPRRQLLTALVVVGWTLVQFALGERLYLSLSLILFILMTLLQGRTASVLLGCAALLLVFTQTNVWQGAQHLFEKDAQVAQNMPANLQEILAPDSGKKQALPMLVYYMLQFMQKHPLQDFSLAGQKFQDQKTQQRIIESAWPARLDPVSKNVFVLPDAMADYKTCTVIDQRINVELVRCP